MPIGPNAAQVVDQGQGTSGTTTTITDAGRSWDTNVWANYLLHIIDGTNVGQVRKIASNTATVITVTNAFGSACDTTTKYVITRGSA